MTLTEEQKTLARNIYDRPAVFHEPSLYTAIEAVAPTLTADQVPHIVKQCLGAITDEESMWAVAYGKKHGYTHGSRTCVDAMLQERAQQLLHPKPKDRVTVRPITNAFGQCFNVIMLDSDVVLALHTEKDANRYAAGLRAELVNQTPKEE